MWRGCGMLAHKKKLILMLLLKKKRLLLLKKIMYLRKLNPPRRPKQFGVGDIFRQRQVQGDGYHLIEEMRLKDPEYFFNYTRLSCEMFEELLEKVGPNLRRRQLHTTISPVQRLAMTLRYLANGNSMTDLGFAYRCHKSTVSEIIRTTTEAIAYALEDSCCAPPSCPQEWLDIEKEFDEQWQMPHCVGAIDGKHIMIQAYQADNSLHFNYKGFFSTISLAVVDANYNFIIVDIGAEGSMGDAGTFANSVFGQRMRAGNLQLPEPSFLARSPLEMPYFFVGDSAFPMLQNLLKPYGGKNASHDQRVFDYRLSRARRVVENAFGILSSRWRIFRRPICALPDTVCKIIKAAVSLHNYANRASNKVKNRYCPPNYVDVDADDGSGIQRGAWRLEVEDDGGGAIRECSQLGTRNAKKTVYAARDELKHYLNHNYKLPWQDETVINGFWGSK